MLNELKKYLNQPYPFYYKGKKLIQISVVIFFLAFFFNYIVQPFGTTFAELKLSFFLVAFIHAISPVSLLLFLSLILTQVEGNTENWKLKYEFLFIIFFIFFIGIFQFFLRDILYNNLGNWSWFYLKEEISHAFIIGSILAFLIVSTNLNIQFYKNSERASALNLNLREKETLNAETKIHLETEVKSESFLLDIQTFVFAKSQGNYLEVWINDETGIKPLLKRLKIKDLDNVLHVFPNIIRTHRSYLLNINYIENVNGNAQGYKIHIKNCKEIIPVSRNYLEPFNNNMKLK